MAACWQNVEMFILGGDDIADYFRNAYRHLAYGPAKADPEKQKEGIITR